MSSGLCTITRGFICNPISAEVTALVSCRTPETLQILEVRPRIRGLVAVPIAQPTLPVTISAKELRPIMRSARSPAPPSSGNTPIPHVVIELRPHIKKAEEE